MFKKKGKQLQENKIVPPASDMQPTDFVYPSGLRLVLLMTSIFVGMFLIVLVRSNQQTPPRALICTCKLTSLVHRINLSSQPQYPRSPTNSTRRTILAGMAQPTCSPTAHSCWYLEKYTPSSTSKPPF
jgi:hypothetical protein